jgi:hypothetical protein
MAIRERLVLVPQAGATLVLIDQWAAATLPAEELPLFEAAKQRHDDFINSKASSVNLIDGESIFDDETKHDEAQSGGDMDYLFYWYRYLTETGTTVEKVIETI